MAGHGQSCTECGADGRLGNCTELFHALLALDHQRRQPWGRHHGLNVACYRLQHPSEPPASLGASWQLVTVFARDGLDAVNALEADWTRRNRSGYRTLQTTEAPPPRITPATVSIADVAVDGTFPAEGYEHRMLAWALAVKREREHLDE